MELWHHRLGHPSTERLAHLANDQVAGLPLTPAQVRAARKDSHVCDGCMFGKMKSKPFTSTGTVTEQPLGLVHFDLSGPYPASLTGNKYGLHIVDDCTNFTLFRALRDKRSATQEIIMALTKLEVQSGHQLRAVMCDGAAEHHALAEWMEQRGVAQRFSAPYTPQMNGKAEALVGILKRATRAMLHAAQQPITLWDEAMRTAAFLRNVLPAPGGLPTPWQQLLGSKPDISWLRVWGCPAYARVPTEHQRGLQPVAEKGVFVGYQPDSIQYRILIDGVIQTYARQHVAFVEEAVLQPNKGGNADQTPVDLSGLDDSTEGAGTSAGNGQQQAVAPPAPPPPPAPQVQAVSRQPPRFGAPVGVPLPRGAEGAREPAAAAAAQPRPLKERMESLLRKAGALPTRTQPPAQTGAAPSRPPTQRHITGFDVGAGVADDDDDDVVQPPAPPPVDPQPRPDPADPPNDRAEDPLVEGLFGDDRRGDELATTSTSEFRSEDDDDGFESSSSQPDSNTASGSAGPSRPKRAAGQVSQLKTQEMARQRLLLATDHPPDPLNMKEALARPDAEKWKEAVQAELASLHAHGTWVLVDSSSLPPNTKLIDSRWLFKTKRNADGTIAKYKARLVARGFMQELGVDYEEVYAPTSKHTTVRAVLALAAAKGLTVRQCDVVTAFLHGNLEEEVYMKQPQGLEAGSPGMVCKLRKSLYGLKQAPRAWHTRLRSELMALGFTPANADASLFTRRESDGSLTILVAYVDDCLIAGRGENPDVVIQQLKKVFNLTDLGSPNVFVGLEIKRDSAAGTIRISQSRMARDLVNKFGLGECKLKNTPLSVGTRLVRDEGEPLDQNHSRSYRELVGSLLYLACCTRCDIAHSVGVLSRFMATPTASHLTAAKGVLRYIASTIDMGITYGKDVKSELYGFCDADFAGCPSTRRSTTAYAFNLYGGVISWASRLQPTVAVSTAEAEYMSAAAAVKEALWLKTLMSDLGMTLSPPLIIFGDNQACLKLLKHPIASARSKHIDVLYHFARSHVESGAIEFQYISTSRMAADCLTKALPEASFNNCLASLGMSF